MRRGGLQELLDSNIDRWGVPGAQLGLLQGGARTVVCSGHTGDVQQSPVVPDTTFAAGSLAKSVTALLVLDAARRG